MENLLDAARARGAALLAAQSGRFPLTRSGARRRRHKPEAVNPPDRARSEAGCGYPPLVITASVSPVATAAPADIGSSATVPDLWAVISFSIFMASITATSAPSSTAAPFLDGHLQDRALEGGGEDIAALAVAGPAPLPGARGGLRGRPGRPRRWPAPSHGRRADHLDVKAPA